MDETNTPTHAKLPERCCFCSEKETNFIQFLTLNHTLLYCLLFLFTSDYSFGQQNLILNGDFEEYWECPDDLTQIEKCKNVYNPCYHSWSPPNPPVWSSTSDYFNTCASIVSQVNVPSSVFGYQNAYSGNGYLGLSNCEESGNYKEYVQLSFTDSLLPFSIYQFSLYLNLADVGGNTSKHLGFAFTDQLVYYNNYVSEFLTPDVSIDTLQLTDTTEWKKINFEYAARGGEKYVIIGNFHSNSAVDNVFNNLDSLPNIGGFAYFYIDSASLVYLRDVPPIQVPNVFTPNGDGDNDYLTLIEGEDQIDEFTVLNRWGNQVYYSKNNLICWDGKTQNKEVSEGVYFYMIKPKVFNEKRKEQYSGMIHLIR